MNIPLRGEIWIIDLNLIKGSEIKKTRPCLVISRSDFNKKSNTITIIPCSSGAIRYPAWEIEFDQSTGLDEISRFMVPQMMVVAKERLKKRIGIIPAGRWSEIEEKIMFYLGFEAKFDEIDTFLI